MWKIGHRGACGHAPENTLLSMKKALDLKVDAFEFDIRLAHGGEPVVIHDDTLDRTTNATGPVRARTVAELGQLDAGQGEGVPSFEDVLKLVDGKCRLLIELKDEHSEAPVVEMLAHAVKSGKWSWEQLIVCSFDHCQILRARESNENILTCALLVGIPVTMAKLATEARAWGVNPAHLHVNQAFMDDARGRGLKVLLWTVNDPMQIARARTLRPDGIISDFPDRL